MLIMSKKITHEGTYHRAGRTYHWHIEWLAENDKWFLTTDDTMTDCSTIYDEGYESDSFDGCMRHLRIELRRIEGVA